MVNMFWNINYFTYLCTVKQIKRNYEKEIFIINCTNIFIHFM